jgi:hypothetical protein
MRRYSQTVEETIRAQSLVREWRHSGLLGLTEAARLESELAVDLKRTNFFFRAVLFVFGLMITGAVAWFIAETFHLTDDPTLGMVFIGLAVACFGVAQWLVASRRLYRFGIEEALLFVAGLLLSLAAALVLGDHKGLIALTTASICGLSLFMTFGYVHAAIAALACAAFVPFTISLSGEVQRLLAALICVAVFLVVRPRRLLWNDDYPGDDYGVIQAATWAGTYYALNLKMSYSFLWHFDSGVQGLFYWFTYLMTWILPIIGLRLSIFSKDRPLMDLSSAMLLVTLITNKPYLGLTRQPWDPILFGLVLIGAAMGIKRWLSRGPNAQRYGYTADRLLAGDRRLLDAVATASAALQPHAPAHDSEPHFTPGGGRSGGAGASGSF